MFQGTDMWVKDYLYKKTARTTAHSAVQKLYTLLEIKIKLYFVGSTEKKKTQCLVTSKYPSYNLL